jgi:hypothetical protein
MLRAAPHGSSQRAQVQWEPRAGGSFRTLETVSVHNPNGVLAVHVDPPGAGIVRVAWRPPGGGQVYYSRDVAVGG